MFTPNSDPMLMRRIVDDMSQAPPAGGHPRGSRPQRLGWRRRAEALQVPVVAINSDLGGVTDEARLRGIATQFSVVTVTGLGHFLMMEDPARFNPILDDRSARSRA